MPKRCHVDNALGETQLKKSSLVPMSPTADVKPGMILSDINGKKWRLGKTIGTGGFGEIFLASDIITRDVKTNAQYVAKVESHTSGPLFVEIHCYLNIAKLEILNEWKSKTSIKHLGIPHHVAFGSHIISKTKYRFLIIPRFESDLQKMFEIKMRKFNLKTVLAICLQIIDALQYIHSKGYLHLDIKASNIGFKLSKKKSGPNPVTPISSRTLGRYGSMPVRTCKVKRFSVPRVLRPNSNLRTLDLYIEKENNSEFTDKNIDFENNADKVYLLDYGLACKYVGSDGIHKEFSKDQRRAHAGTILFCSRDAHLGAQSRRSDLECLGYNLIYWLTSSLPWSENTDNPDIVYKKKLKCINNLREFIDFSFDYLSPNFVHQYFAYLLKLEFEEEPDYNYCKTIFRRALQEYGYNDDMRLDFDSVEGWNNKPKNTKLNVEIFRKLGVTQKFKRTPLNSNLPVRPVLRKEIVNKKLKQRLNWSRILKDPEILMKKAKSRSKERKMTESSDSNSVPTGIINLDINQLNPNAAMLEVFSRSLEKLNTTGGVSPNSRGDCIVATIDGYTPAMMEVYNKKREREEAEAELNMLLQCKSPKSIRNRPKKSNPSSKIRKIKNGRISKTDTSSSKKEKKPGKITSLRRIYSLRG